MNRAGAGVGMHSPLVPSFKKGRATSADNLVLMSGKARWSREFWVQSEAETRTTFDDCSDDEDDDFIFEEDITSSMETTDTMRCESEDGSVSKGERRKSKQRDTSPLQRLKRPSLLTKLQVQVPSVQDSTSPQDCWDRTLYRQVGVSVADTTQDDVRSRARSIDKIERMASKLRMWHEKQMSRRKLVRRSKTMPILALQSFESNIQEDDTVSVVIQSMPNVITPQLADAAYDPVIIFDWDDTLLPTAHLSEVVFPGKGSREYTQLPEDSPYLDALAAHAQEVRAMLLAARDMARVAIVTLGAAGWVEHSAEWFLPGAGIPELLKELKIPIYYARDHVTEYETKFAQEEEGVDLFKVAKQKAMVKCLRKFYPRGANRWDYSHIICIGDSNVEIQAAKDLVWSYATSTSLFKGIKLLEQPTLEVLTMQLKLLQSWLPQIVSHSEDAHIVLDDAISCGDGDIGDSLLGYEGHE